MSELKIWKVIWEIRFPATASLFDNRGKIASKWQWTSDLTEWRISNNQVTIHNKASTIFLNAGIRNVNVVMELPTNYKSFVSQASDFSAWTLDILQIRKIERIGLRIIQITERKHFKLLVTKIRQQIYKFSDDDWSILGGPPEDVGMPLTLNIGEDKVNFQFGPMKKEQLVGYFESNDVKDKLPSVALFFDIDLYRNNPEVPFETQQQVLSDFLGRGGEQILKLSEGFMEKFGGFA
jgi:hypothetical protein